MMTLIEEKRIRLEVRGLRQRIARVTHWWNTQKESNQRVIDEIANLKKTNQGLEKEITALKNQVCDLKEKLEAVTCHKDTLTGMIFKPNTKKQQGSFKTRTRGARIGHPGHSRKKPDTIDQEKEVYLTNCPECESKLKPTNTHQERLVTEITVVKPTITKYFVQR